MCILYKVNNLNSISVHNQQLSDDLEGQVLATSAMRRILVISWKDLREAAMSDKPYADLLHAVHQHNEDWPEQLSEYRQFCQLLTTVNGVVLYKGRVVVPSVLRPQALQALHRAHQGETGMRLRTNKSMWWPGINTDIENTRAQCITCRRNAPTQLPLPPVPPPVPRHPFQLISSDYFHYDGHNYLVIINRYSNWPVIRLCKS